jgi:hypothetical protein
MTGAVHGDPASCSQTGGALRRLASRITAATGRAEHAGAALDEVWSGRVAREIGQRQRLLVDTARGVAAELDRAGSALQEHATDLAETLQELRAIEESAAAAGLRVVDGRVELPWGVRGVADEGAAAARESRRADLQAQLDRVVMLHARRRARLCGSVEAARAVLAEHATGLQR